MTLIELMVTIAIIGIITAAAIPSFRGLQARQALKVSQRSVQSAIYRMQQLALAPPQSVSATYDIVGYGLAFHKATAGSTNVLGCRIQAENDFILLYKYVRFRDSSGLIAPVLNPFEPDAACDITRPRDYPGDIYVLPSSLAFNASASASASNPPTPLPWLLPVPLRATGTSLGEFELPFGYGNPLPVNEPAAIATLVIDHRSITVGERRLCRTISFARQTNDVAISTTLTEDCV